MTPRASRGACIEKQVVGNVYWLDAGPVLDDFFHVMRVLGMTDLLANIHGIAIPREIVPFVQSVLRYGLKKLFGIDL